MALQVVAALMAIIALGFGAPAPFVAAHLLRDRQLPTFVGLFPMYGGGLASGASPEAFAALLALFTAVCALDLFAAVLVWQGLQLGGFVMLAMLPFELAFWLAFALPIPPLFALVRLALLWANWSALK